MPHAERKSVARAWWMRWPREKLTLAILFACVLLWLPVLLVVRVF
jgi:hypothetical protein